MSRVVFSKPFQLEGGRNLEFTFDTNVNNNWCYLIVDLVNEATGEVVTFDADVEAYYGVDLGEAWSEGDQVAKRYLGAVPGGTYLLRVERQFPWGNSIDARVTLREGVFRPMWLLIALGVLFTIPLLVFLAWFSFEKRRWSESDHPWFEG